MSRDRTAMVRLLRQVEYRERRAKLVWSSRYRLVVVGFDGVALHQAGFDDQARALFERLAGEPGEAGRVARNNLRIVRRAQARRAFAADPELARRHGTLERYREHLGLR